MADKNSVSDWSTTPDSNDNIAGIATAENLMRVRDVNNAIRNMMAQLKTQLSTVAGWDGIAIAGTSIASASTINLTTATGPLVDITGTTTVSTVTLGTGKLRIARAAAAFQLTASSTLIVNGSSSANYTTGAGDLLMFEGYGSSVVRVWVIGSATPAARAVRQQVFVASGTYTPDAHLIYADIELVGGGGGSGGINATTSTSSTATGGGGAGGYSRSVVTAATVGASQTVTVGAAGSAGTTSGTTGGTGGSTSVGSLVSAVGGAGGAGVATGAGGANGGDGGAGASGVGTVTLSGGGGAAGAGTPTANSTGAGAMGGASFFGGGGKGGTWSGGGTPGAAPGSGAGGSTFVGIGTRAGAAGALGIVIITEYCSA